MRITLSILCILIFTVTGYSQKELSLNQAISTALQRNPTLQKNKNNISNYEYGVKQSYGNFLPSISASGGWRWNHSEDEGVSYNIGSIVIQTPKSVTESRSFSANVDGSWTLFDGLSNFASLSKSKNDLEAARLSLQRLKQDIVIQTINYYYDIINWQQLLKVKEEDVKWNKKNLETITERNKLGAVTIADVYAQQVKVANAELSVIQTRNSFETAKSALLYYLGLDVLENYTFTDSVSQSEIGLINNKLDTDYENLNELVPEALKNRLDYKSKKMALKSAYNNVTIANSGHLPRLSNNFGYSLFGNKFKTLLDSKTYNVGLSLSIPIFSGFSVENRVEQATVYAKNQEIELSDLERSIKTELQKTFLDLQAAKKALEVGKRSVAASEENRKIEQEKYNIGAGTLLNVLIANSDYTNALTNYINAEFDYVKRSEQLKYYLGIIDYKKYE